jgi:hypothetical protein
MKSVKIDNYRLHTVHMKFFPSFDALGNPTVGSENKSRKPKIRKFADFKGLSHEIDFKNFDKNL